MAAPRNKNLVMNTYREAQGKAEGQSLAGCWDSHVGSLGCQGRARPAGRGLPPAVGGTWAGRSHPRPLIPFRGAGSSQGFPTFPESQQPHLFAGGMHPPKRPQVQWLWFPEPRSLSIAEVGQKPGWQSSLPRAQSAQTARFSGCPACGVPLAGTAAGSALRAEDRSELPLPPFAETEVVPSQG